MAEQLKHFFNEQVVRSIASDLSRVCPSFRERPFVDACITGLADLELTSRAWHVADVMYDNLPRPFVAAAEILVASLGPEIPPTGENGLAPLRYMPHVFLVQKYGLDDFEAAMRAQYELTKRFSAESSIRAFLVKYPEKTYARLREWARNENAHVRRLVSEGTRPRLPWAPRLRAFQEDPLPVIALLELLKDDPERYVQRSVANNLNDIGKDHPGLAVEVCRRWQTGASPGREWIVRHALRSLVKKGHRSALKALGVGGKPNVSVTGVRLVPSRVKLGGELRFAAVTSRYVEQLGIRMRSLDQPIGGLSGGNQQKCVLSCWLALSTKVLILDEPTRGIDVGAKATIYGLIGDLAEQGLGVIFISSDLPEVLGLSDRVVVMSEGRIMATLDRADASPEAVMRYASHVSRQ